MILLGIGVWYGNWSDFGLFSKLFLEDVIVIGSKHSMDPPHDIGTVTACSEPQ